MKFIEFEHYLCPMQPASISMYMSNVETIPGMTIAKSLGLVTGSTVRAKHLGKDIAVVGEEKLKHQVILTLL